MQTFSHLHVHSYYSILDGIASPKQLLQKAKNDGMTAMALTDHGNMFGIKDFYNEAKKIGIKPILGCEAYMSTDRFEKKSSSTGKRDYFHIILLAKNITGYKNLLKLISYSWIEGFYYKPRIDNELLEKYHEGIIVSSACLGGEIPQAILKKDIATAEKTVQYFKNLFGSDFYLELQRHNVTTPGLSNNVFEKQQEVNKYLIEFSKKYNVKLIATNDVHFVNKEDADTHDHLICITTGSNINDTDRLRYTWEEYLKSPSEMAELFSDIPEAITNTQEIVEKIEDFELDKAPIMPDFKIPDKFESEGDYLKFLVYEGAKKRYGNNLTEEIKNRIDFELHTVIDMGYPGYFLIVWDLIRHARQMGVSVGPGRGSAAGSIISYVLEITQIDPIKYGLLFERFLNPERISLPDIDIDFDEDGRDKVLSWVSKKYGYEKVAQLITFGKMAPKMAIRDVARVRDLPLFEANRLAKMVPAEPKTTFKLAYEKVPELKKERENSPNPEIKKTLEVAEKLEGCIRQTGTHACGVIIGKNNLMEEIPVLTQKDNKLLITQFEGAPAEECGMLKMDFLGLKTLSIIRDAVREVKKSKGIELDIDKINLEDKKTLELFSRGETIGIFQFESDGMRENLRSLKPDKFSDIIAMAALYRPGPMQYIPIYIKRRHGKEKITYDIPQVEKHLQETYGITVYQEQVMLLSQDLAGFTKGEADALRKAMGKKKRFIIDKMKPKFIDGCIKNNIQKEKAEKIWRDWENFAEYAFNKSHSTCYAYLAFQAAYLKAHYPHEFLVASLGKNISETKKIVTFINDAKRMKISILPPDINESFEGFTLTKDNKIYYGLNAIKNVGENVAHEIIKERQKNGHYQSIYNLMERLPSKVMNKRVLEALAQSGALDKFGIPRHIFFETKNSKTSFVENLIAYGNIVKASKANLENTLFGDIQDVTIKLPEIPNTTQEWSVIEKLNKEKEAVGIYLSSHPLDKEQTVIDLFTNADTQTLKNPEKKLDTTLKLIAYISEANHLTTKTGNPYGKIKIEDKSGVHTLTFFGKDYIKFKNYFTPNYILYINGKFVKNEYRKGEIQFKVNQIKLINEFLSEKKENIAIEINIKDITDENIDKITAIKKFQKGNNLLQIKIVNANEKYSIKMFSRNIKLKLEKSLFNYLNNLDFIRWEIK